MQNVRREERVSVDGTRLYLLIRGDDADAPLLLWLHGGPGGAETPLFRLFDSGFEENFLVAYWDQRGAGRSFDKKADPSLLTVRQHLADLDAVVDHLRNEFGKEKLVLIGHSWGSELGLLYAQKHPEKVAAFIGVNQVVSLMASEKSQYAFALSEARRRHDAAELKRLSRIGPPPYSAKEELAVQKIVDRYGGLFHDKPNFGLVILKGLLRGYVAPWEIGKFIRANTVSLAAMNDELLSLDLAASVAKIRVPVMFALGRYDHQVDPALAVAYLDKLDAPRKSVVWFDGSAHNIPFEQPKVLHAAVVRFLRDVGAVEIRETPER